MPINTPSSKTIGAILRSALNPCAACAAIKPQTTEASARKAAAQGASNSPGSWVAAIKAWNEEAREPNVTDHAWPIEGITTALIGENPSPISSGAVTAVGTPKPPTPCRNDAKIQPMSSACMARSAVSRGRAELKISMAPASSLTR